MAATLVLGMAACGDKDNENTESNTTYEESATFAIYYQGQKIAAGDTIGLIDDSIESIGASVEDVTLDILEKMEADDADDLMILAGEDMDDERFEALVARIQEQYEDLEIDAQRGEQPLYPIVLSVE